MPKMFFDPLLEKGYLQKADTPDYGRRSWVSR